MFSRQSGGMAEAITICCSEFVLFETSLVIPNKTDNEDATLMTIKTEISNVFLE